MRPVICQSSEEIQRDARDRLLAPAQTVSTCLSLAPRLGVLAPHLPPLSQQTPSCSCSGTLPAIAVDPWASNEQKTAWTLTMASFWRAAQRLPIAGTLEHRSRILWTQHVAARLGNDEVYQANAQPCCLLASVRCSLAKMYLSYMHLLSVRLCLFVTFCILSWDLPEQAVRVIM